MCTLLGTVAAGRFAAYTNPHVSQGLAVGMMAVSVACAPWWRNILIISGFVAVLGFSTGLHYVCELKVHSLQSNLLGTHLLFQKKDLEPFLKAMYRIAGTIWFCAHLSNFHWL